LETNGVKQSNLPLLLLIAAPAAIVNAQVPPPANAKAPQLSPVTERQVRPVLTTPQHCELKIGDNLRLVATEQGRYAVAVINGTMSVLPYDGRNPIRNGGRFLAAPTALDVWISVQQREDQWLARGLPRHVSVMVNGNNGGSDACPGLYICNY
jgi:hypothetical protein